YLGALRGRMGEVAAHQAWPFTIPAGNRAFTAHRGKRVKESAAGFSGDLALITDESRDHWACDNFAACSARAPVHRPNQHYRSIGKSSPDTTYRLFCIFLVLDHRQTLVFTLVRAIGKNDQIRLPMVQLLGPMLRAHVVSKQTYKRSVHSQRIVLDTS